MMCPFHYVKVYGMSSGSAVEKVPEILTSGWWILQGEPAAHTGFVRRARSIPVQKLLEAAEAKGKKLVLCGKQTINLE